MVDNDDGAEPAIGAGKGHTSAGRCDNLRRRAGGNGQATRTDAGIGHFAETRDDLADHGQPVARLPGFGCLHVGGERTGVVGAGRAHDRAGKCCELRAFACIDIDFANQVYDVARFFAQRYGAVLFGHGVADERVGCSATLDGERGKLVAPGNQVGLA